MAPPQRSYHRPKTTSRSPEERSAELAEFQRRLKQEAAERRLKAPAQRPPTAKRRGRG